MNDFEYEVRQKKQLSRNAIYKKGGSKSKKCSLPSDHMTKAEWKRRNGKVEGYSLNKPLTFKEWSAMPDDIQKEYWVKLRERFYNIANSRIRRDMLHTSEPTLNNELERLGLPRHPIINGVVKNTIHSRDADLDQWYEWLGMPTHMPSYRPNREERNAEITATVLEHQEERKKENRCAINSMGLRLYGNNKSLEREFNGIMSYLPEGKYIVEFEIKQVGKRNE